jgi:hypothetical protein
MWEGNPWSIKEHVHCQTHKGDLDLSPCKHSQVINSDNPRWEKIITHDDRDITYEVQWIVPRVVVGQNEGGFNSVGICLDCILEAAKTLE